MLPPVVDIGLWRQRRKSPGQGKDKNRIKNFAALLEKHYQMKPVIYTTGNVYHIYIIDDFYENDIWIRNIFGTKVG